MNDLTRIHALPAAPARPMQSHKGTFGAVIVIGGSATMIGAPAIAATAALRSGVGLVKIATDPAVLAYAIMIQPGATGVERGPDPAVIDQADPEKKAVLAIGPGLGGKADTWSFLEPLLAGPRTFVLDADGLNLLASQGRTLAGSGPRVLTPHPGEFKRLAKALAIEHSPTNETQRPQAAAKLAQAHQAVVVLKGLHTVVTDGSRYYLNDTGNPALATAGTGDVLTGLTASLLAQGMAPFDAATLAVHVHGHAADLWADHHGQAGMPALDLAQQLPAALNPLRQR